MTCKIWPFIIGIVVSFNFFQATNGLPLNSSEGELVNNIETSNKLNRQKRDFDLNPNKIDETALYIGKNSIFFFISYLLDILFDEISTSIRLRIAFIFGVQTL